jgi:hypothetical protein
MLSARAGTLSNMRVNQILTGTGGNITYTVRINGVDTALSVTMTAGTAVASNLVNAVSVAAGDTVDVRVTKASTISLSPSDIVLTMEFNI